jgi:acyl-CoA synthetase (AMP-forming)/AMP-acid ligase II
MIVNRIYEWARVQPNKSALIHNDTIISYAVFARAIEATLKFFKQQNLPTGRTAIVLVEQRSEAWIIVLALRALGLNTICVRSISTAEELKVRDAACVVVTQIDQPKFILKDNTLAGAKLVVVPTALSKNINSGDIPHLMDNSPPFGAHILYTSGTTGYYKKILLLGSTEEDRNFRRSRDYGFDRNTVGHVVNMGLMTGFGFKHPPAIWHVGGGVVFDQRPDALSRVFSTNLIISS